MSRPAGHAMPRVRELVTTGLYFGLVAVLLLPIWANDYFLTQDGPMHLHNARIFLDHWRGRATDFYAEYYVPNLVPFPYWIGHLSGALLLSLCAPATAEKVFLTACIIVYAVALRSLVRAVDVTASPLAFAGLPLIWNRNFQMGFFEFISSIGVMLALLAFYVRRMDSFSWPRAAALSLFFVLLYFCHPTTYLITVACVLCLAVCNAPRFWSRIVIALAPSALLMGLFLHGAPNYAIPHPTPVAALLLSFIKQSNLTTWSTAEAPVAGAVSLMFLGLAVAAIAKRIQSGRDRYDAFVVAAIAALLMNVYGSARLVGFFERLQFMPLLLLLPWLAARRWSSAAHMGVMACSALLVTVFVAIRAPRQALASARVEEYVSVQSAIDPRSTVLILNYDYGGRTEGGTDNELLPIYVHAGEYLGASDRSLIILNNIGGLYRMYPYLWRSERNPFEHLATEEGIEGDPPSAELLGYRVHTSGRVDYVIVLGLATSPLKIHPTTVNLVAQLERGYTRVFASAHEGAVVYKAQEPPPSAALAAAHLDRSFRLYQMRRFAQSIEAAQQVLALEPASDRAYNNICAAFNSMEQWELAIAACNDALRLNPDNQLAKNNRTWAQDASHRRPQ